MKSIRLIDVSRAFGRTFALHRVSLELEPGSTTILLGANGAGKTTLLNILATLDAPTSGEIHYGEDVDWQNFSRRGRRNIGWVSHDSLVYDDLTGMENLEFYADLYGVGADPCAAWLDRVGLTDAADQLVRTYSRGMRQRLSIARALLHAPSILLLDEPLTGLDRVGRGEILELLSKLRDQGRFIVMITHDLDLPEDFVDNLAVLNRGKLAFFGPIDDSSDMVRLFRDHA